MAQKFIFLDRDGTLILDVPYLRDPKKVQLLEHVIEGLVHLKNAGFRFGIVTNQSGIDRGLVTLDELRAVNQHMCELFREFNLFFDFIIEDNSVDFCKKESIRHVKLICARIGDH